MTHRPTACPPASTRTAPAVELLLFGYSRHGRPTEAAGARGRRTSPCFARTKPTTADRWHTSKRRGAHAIAHVRQNKTFEACTRRRRHMPHAFDIWRVTRRPPHGSTCTRRPADGKIYLDLLERVGHHGDEHVDENDDGHRMVHHQHILADLFGERLRLALANGVQLGQPEERPEERHVALQNAWCTS